MYRTLDCPATIVYRFPTGELLLRHGCNEDDVYLYICDSSLELHQLQVVVQLTDRVLPLITSASIRAIGCPQPYTCEIYVSYLNSTEDDVLYWHYPENYDPNRVVTHDTFIWSDGTIVKIPHSLRDFFSIGDYACILEFKHKMLLARSCLLREVPGELASCIVAMSCHAYKNYNCASYLDL